ncbi:MAG: hypothetical protein JWN95_3580 [Frankiales bacterium]|nr:hypothetical protein [Frankiales bacterium]
MTTTDRPGNAEALLGDFQFTEERGIRPANRVAPDRTDVPTAPVDRIGALWAGKWIIVLATLAVMAATAVGTRFVPSVYSSDAEVSLAASPTSGGAVSDLVTAGNSLAAQYAQVVVSTPVLQTAAESSGANIEELRSHTSSGTVASQNIVRITVQAASPEAAQRDAQAMANSLVTYIKQQSAAQAKTYGAAIIAQLAPLAKQIDSAQQAVDSARDQLNSAASGTSQLSVSAASASLASAQSLLTTLTDRQAALSAQGSLQGASLTPSAAVLGSPSAATQTQPRPLLYVAIAIVLGFAISAQCVIVAAERRRRLAAARRR